MRSIFIYVLLLNCVFLDVQAFKNQDSVSRTTIIIENPTGNRFSVEEEYSPIIVFNQYESFKKRDTIVINSNNNFRFVFSEIDASKQYIYTSYWLKPDENIYVTITETGIITKSKLNQERTNELNFFGSMRLALGNFEGLMTFIPHKRKDPVSLLKAVKTKYGKEVDFLNTYAKTNHISSQFQAELEAILLYKSNFDFLSHCETTGIFDKSLLYSVPEVRDFLEGFASLKPSNQNIYFLEAAVLAYKLNSVKEIKLEAYSKTEFKKLHENLQDLIKFKELFENLDNPDFKVFMDDFLSTSNNDGLKEKAIENFGDFWVENKKINAKECGKNEILLYNLKSKEIIKWEDLISISGLKYIDFWATWCGGYRTSMPKVRDFESKINNPAFKVIYISIDKNAGAWEKISRKENILDENSFLLLYVEDNALLKKYQIQTIPRYMLVDHKGNVLDTKAPDVYTDPQFYEKVSNLLKE